jgi:uncharacterized protein YbjQ (UPF0145 family)
MDYKTNKYGPIILVVSILVVMVASLASGQEARAEGESPIFLVIFAVCLGPLILLGLFMTVFSLIYAIAYPPLLLYSAIFSQSNLRKHMESILERERASISHFGKDPLSTLKGADVIAGIQQSGLVYGNVVYSPSHWHLLIGWFNNLVGGSITVLQEVVAVARAEAKQRLRENAAEEGWEDVLNVRIETSMMSKPGSQTFVKGAVEVFAYGTGVSYGK